MSIEVMDFTNREMIIHTNSYIGLKPEQAYMIPIVNDKTVNKQRHQNQRFKISNHHMIEANILYNTKCNNDHCLEHHKIK